MRRVALTAGVLTVAAVLLPALAAPAHAGPDLVHVYSNDGGTGAYVGKEAHPIVGAGVNYYSETVCVVVGYSATCTPDLT